MRRDSTGLRRGWWWWLWWWGWCGPLKTEPEEPRPRGEAYGFKKQKMRRHGNSQLCPSVPPACRVSRIPRFPDPSTHLKLPHCCFTRKA